MRPAHRVTAAVTTVLLAGVLAGCGPDDPGPTTESGTPTPTRSTTMSPTATPTPSPTTAEQKAYAAAEASYRAWVTAYAEANKTFDASKLDSTHGTKGLNALAAKDFAKFRAQDAKKNEKTTGKFSQDVRSIKGSLYTKGQAVQLAICAVTNSRFLDKNGKDVTLDGPNGNPLPVNTIPRQNQFQFVTPDGGKTWQLNSFVPGSRVGAQC